MPSWRNAYAGSSRSFTNNGLDRTPPAGKPAATRAAPTAQPPVDQAAVESIVNEKLKQQKPIAGWNDGFFLESPNGDFKMKPRGYIQTQVRDFPSETGRTGADSIFMRRVRAVIEGTVFKYFDYKFMPSFDSGTAALQDAYFDITYLRPWVSFRGGRTRCRSASSASSPAPTSSSPIGPSPTT